MNNLILSILFFTAFSGTTYFIGKLLTWMVFKINPASFETPFTNRDKNISSIIMIFSIFIWSVLFYNLLKN